MHKIREKILQHKILVFNFSSLSALQLINILIPLATYPYLIRVLGKESYGLVVFAQSVVGYLVTFVSFGFNTFATKEISVFRNDKKQLNQIVSSVYIIKSILLIVSFSIITIILFFFYHNSDFYLLFYLTMWICLYEAIFPLWYFQGTEKMKYITIITLVSRLIFVALIFLLIHKEADYNFVPIIYGIGALISGLISIFIVFQQDGLKFKLQSFSTLKYYFTNSSIIFFSDLSSAIYINTNKVLLGISLGMQEVAYYDLAEKLSSFARTPILMIGQTIYPKIAYEKNLSFIKKSFILTISFMLIIVLFGQLLGGIVVKLMGGAGMYAAAPIFRILLFSLIPISVSLFFANMVLISWGFFKEYLKLRVYSNLIYLTGIALIYFLNSLNLYSLALMTVFIELTVMAYSIYFSNKHSINFLIHNK